MRWLASFVICLLLAALAGSAHAESDTEPRVSITSSGLCGLLYTGSPTCPKGFAATATAGYATMQLHGHHDRLLGNLGFAYTPLDWLSVSLELVGRIDIHPDDERGNNITGTGDPWLRGRAGWPVRKGLVLGGELGLWIPGNDAPSFTASATTVEAKGLATYQLAARWQLLGTLGFRLDNSANSAPDLTRLRVGDRIALGLSDSHAVLLGVGGAYFVLPELQTFGELSAQLHVGADAPELLESPLRLAGGARYFLKKGWQVELTLISSLSQRPSIAADAPLVPIEPRFSALIGARYQFGGPKAVVVVEQAPPIETASDEPQLATVQGVLHDEQGAPLPDANVTLKQGLAEQAGITDAEGRYQFHNVIPGQVQLSASAAGFETASFEVSAVAPLTTVPPRALVPAGNQGSLRCLVRSFTSKPIKKAQVVVRDDRGRRVAGGTTDAQGLLEISLTSGNYRVMIEAVGYKSQRTNVQVATNEVAILNVDMREGK